MRAVFAGRVRAVVGVLAIGLASSVLAAPTALASKGVVSVFGSGGSGDGQFASAGATAVNDTSHDVYIVDQSNNRVEQFDAAGSFIRAWGWGVADGSAAAETCSSGCQAGIAGSGDGQFDTPQGVAIDQTDGSVYVVDGNNSRVEKFDSSGAFQSQFGTAGSGDGQLSGPQGIAVDPTDRSVYVVDSANNRVEKFDSSGAFLDTFGVGVSDGNEAFEVCTSSCQAGLAVADDGGFSGPTRVAVDSTGRVYVLDGGNGRIERFTSADAFDEQFDPTDVNAGTFPFEIAVGPGNDHLYVAQAALDFSEQRIFEIDSSGSVLDIHGAGSTAGNVSGLALSGDDQQIYVADGFNARVFILADITSPTLTIDPASSITDHSASVSGSVTPNGSPNVGWHFEISTDDANWSPLAADQDAGNGNTPIPASQDLTGLIPNTTYYVRLAGTRPFNLPTFSPEIHFATTALAPDVTTQPAAELSPSHAALRGVIDPHNSPTTYYFEYGTTTTYRTSVPATRDGDAGSADFPVAAIQPVYGLQPGTTYHFRLVAHNQVATITGADQTFTTTTAPPASTPRAGIPGTGYLPDNRGWEQVSPPQKNGGEVMGDTTRTRAASDEQPGLPMAATFSSLTGFGDVHGTGVATDYMAVRTADPTTHHTGWATHGITPPQAPDTARGALFGFEPFWQGALSSDLSRGVFRAWSPLTDAPNVAQVENLYRRTDLRTAGAGSYDLLTDCVVCGSPLPPVAFPLQRPYFDGASNDFTHVIFESQYALVTGATAGHPNLYEWVNGTLRLAGILPDSACGSPPCAAASSEAGQGAATLAGPFYTDRAISADGSRILFTDNSVTGGPTGTLYLRLDGTSTVQVSGSQPAKFWTANRDLSRIFFTTDEQLTADDTNSTTDLYMYDLDAPVGQRLTRLSVSDTPAEQPGDVNGVIGASDDGRYVYFVQNGELLPGHPVRPGGNGIYEWHDGEISFVGELRHPSDVQNDVPSGWILVPQWARVTPDGKHLLFASTSGAGLTGYDDAGHNEFYVYSADTHDLACASCNPAGFPATSDAANAESFNTGGALPTWYRNRPLSDDGRRVFFTTADRLVPEDTNGKQDVYEYDVPSGTVHLLSSGKPDTSDTFFMDASASGSDVFFITRHQLVGWDTDFSYDLYDARVNGGFPNPAPILPCQGDSCHPSGEAPPAAAVPGSGLVTGFGNVPSAARSKPKPLRCRRSSVKRRRHGKLRCVKRGKRHATRVKKVARTAHDRKAR